MGAPRVPPLNPSESIVLWSLCVIAVVFPADRLVRLNVWSKNTKKNTEYFGAAEVADQTRPNLNISRPLRQEKKEKKKSTPPVHWENYISISFQFEW